MHEEAPAKHTQEEYRKPLREQALNELTALAKRTAASDGRYQTAVPFLSINRYSHPTPPIPVVLTPSFCLILQGSKKVHFGRQIIFARSGDFLTSLISMPGTAQVNTTEDSVPYVGLRIDFTTQEIASVITEAGLKISPRDKKLTAGAFIGTTRTDQLELFIRLMKLLDMPEAEARFLSSLVKREMIFKLLSGEYGHLFFQQVFFDQQAEGIGSAIAWIKDHFSRSFTVEELAKASNMSVSGLHHKFKAVTTMGPLQYQKQLRLQEARRLMLSGAMDATTAALEVGYESPSQFNREYRRLFGLPPLQDIKSVQASFSAGLLEQSGLLTFR
ncbi:AraC family transcriptional regulator [Paenibacillus sp. S150]|uniref:AraC family transcriptional regulator n=1 Tax=Paenibacillus sp. S150 TaxID=2749826 RepID=UPI001C5851AE|nr:AraC family transcriptional regulator [Paenibacillus sp. S150]MBW4081197.1 AraC family transcriptional regulator [Paenibacillus sp. S150]